MRRWEWREDGRERKSDKTKNAVELREPLFGSRSGVPEPVFAPTKVKNKPWTKVKGDLLTYKLPHCTNYLPKTHSPMLDFDVLFLLNPRNMPLFCADGSTGDAVEDSASGLSYVMSMQCGA